MTSLNLRLGRKWTSIGNHASGNNAITRPDGHDQTAMLLPLP